MSLALALAFSMPASGAIVTPPGPAIAARAWILMDAQTGVVISQHEADMRLPPASLTKLMTSYALAYELEQGRVDNDDMVLISDDAWAQNPLFVGSSLMWIETGKMVRLEDLHRGIVVSSGNDASVAIAEHIAGDEAVFVQIMNQHAQLLGMDNTRFANSHGLPAAGQHTTARDMAILSRALIGDYPEEYALYREREYTYNNIRQYNRNGLLMVDPTVDGLKTGYTEEAGYCLVASARRGGMRLISVVMGTDSERVRKSESAKLLKYGFRNFETRAIYNAGEKLAAPHLWQGKQEELALGVGRDIHMTMPRGSHSDLQAVMEIDEIITAPVGKGDVHGVLRVSLGGETLLEEPLVALEDAERAGFVGRLWDIAALFFLQLSQD